MIMVMIIVMAVIIVIIMAVIFMERNFMAMSVVAVALVANRVGAPVSVTCFPFMPSLKARSIHCQPNIAGTQIVVL